MMLTKKNMFGGDDGGETEHLLPVEGRLHPGADVGRDRSRSRSSSTPTASATTSTQIYSWYSEQGWGGTRVTFDTDKIERDQAADRGDRARSCRSRRAPRSASATRAVARRWRPAGPERAGAAGRRFHRDAGRARQGHRADPGASARNCATCASTAATRTASWRCASIASVRPRSASARRRWRSFVGLALRGAPLREFRRGETEVPVWVRFAGADDYGIEDIASFTVRAPDGRTVPLLAMVDVQVRPAATQIQRANRQTTLTIQANLADKVTDARRAQGDGGDAEVGRVPGRLQLSLRRRRLRGRGRGRQADDVQPADRAGA